MIAKPDSGKQRLAQAASICLCIYIILCDVLVYMLPHDSRAEFLAVQQLVCFSLLGLILASAPKMSRRTGILFLAGYWVWLIIARAADHVLAESLPYEIFRASAMCCVFYLTCTLEEGGRERLMTWFCGLVFPIFAIWSVLGVLVSANVIPPVPIGDEFIHINLEPQNTGVLRYLRFFDRHRNCTAAWFMTALWISVAQIVRTRRKWLQALLAVFSGMMYVTISLQHCRSVYVSVSVGAGILIWILLKNRLRIPQRSAKVLCVGTVALLTMLATYKGFALCNLAVNSITRPAESTMTIVQTPEEQGEVAQEAAETHQQPERSEEASLGEIIQPEAPTHVEIREEPETGMSDDRNFFRDLLTLTMRTEIWGASLRTTFARKKFVVLGQQTVKIMENLRYYGGLNRDVWQAHNMLLQMLTIGGVFGFTLMMGFLYLQLRSAIRVFLSRDASLEKKIYVIALACLMIYGIMEAMFDFPFTSLCFMLLAGMLAEGRKETV